MRLPSSFRDPSGYLFKKDGRILRQINRSYEKIFNQFINNGLYADLIKDGSLIPHTEMDLGLRLSDDAYKIIAPKHIDFISYPYEWSFSQLKNAALLTLDIQKKAMTYQMSLKDASAYNIQFIDNKPILIDSLSFENYQENKPWVAYRQFCQHFLAPLALMSHTDIRLNQLLKIHIDGIPLDLASLLLPWQTHLNLGLLSHIHLHAKAQGHFQDKPSLPKQFKTQSLNTLGIIDHLRNIIDKMTWTVKSTAWSDYYSTTNYQDEGFEDKKSLVKEYLLSTNSKNVWDLGANTGAFSQIAEDLGIRTISFDMDPACVEKNYQDCLKKSCTHIFPLVLDLTNPSPAIGWANRERMTLLERGPAETVLALALIHHLAISDNLPFGHIAEYLSKLCTHLIIEFVPKEDSQVQRLLSSREDIFSHYDQASFEREFQHLFSIERRSEIKNSERILYLMKIKPS